MWHREGPPAQCQNLGAPLADDLPGQQLAGIDGPGGHNGPALRSIPDDVGDHSGFQIDRHLTRQLARAAIGGEQQDLGPGFPHDVGNHGSEQFGAEVLEGRRVGQQHFVGAVCQRLGGNRLDPLPQHQRGQPAPQLIGQVAAHPYGFPGGSRGLSLEEVYVDEYRVGHHRTFSSTSRSTSRVAIS